MSLGANEMEHPSYPYSPSDSISSRDEYYVHSEASRDLRFHGVPSYPPPARYTSLLPNKVLEPSDDWSTGDIDIDALATLFAGGPSNEHSLLANSPSDIPAWFTPSDIIEGSVVFAGTRHGAGLSSTSMQGTTPAPSASALAEPYNLDLPAQPPYEFWTQQGLPQDVVQSRTSEQLISSSAIDTSMLWQMPLESPLISMTTEGRGNVQNNLNPCIIN